MFLISGYKEILDEEEQNKLKQAVSFLYFDDSDFGSITNK